MDAELKAKWVQALRSGEYEQARGTLKYGDTYCCIGVLCDLQGIDWDVDGLDRAVSVPPERFRAGLTSTHFLPLSNLNDWENKSFPEIADYIDEHL